MAAEPNEDEIVQSLIYDSCARSILGIALKIRLDRRSLRPAGGAQATARACFGFAPPAAVDATLPVKDPILIGRECA